MKTKTFRGGAKPGPGVGPSVTSNPNSTAAGVVIDGAAYPLQGEPPIAQTKGWGVIPGWLPRAWR